MDPVASHERVIEPYSGLSLPDWREAWSHRDLIYHLARRDVAVRYKQSVIGAAWAILQPIGLAGVFSVFFGLLQKVEGPVDVPYPLFVVTGMVMWLFFSSAVQDGSESTVSSADLISKVYFPRIVIPIAAVIPPAVDFAIAFVVVFAISIAYGFGPNVQILLVPLVAAVAMVVALGVSLWTSALNVKYRDVHLVVPFFLLVGLFVTPVVYPFDTVPAELQPIYALNPMVGVLEAFRWMLLDTDPVDWTFIVPAVACVLLPLTGALYFHRAEQSFADVI